MVPQIITISDISNQSCSDAFQGKNCARISGSYSVFMSHSLSLYFSYRHLYLFDIHQSISVQGVDISVGEGGGEGFGYV